MKNISLYILATFILFITLIGCKKEKDVDPNTSCSDFKYEVKLITLKTGVFPASSTYSHSLEIKSLGKDTTQFEEDIVFSFLYGEDDLGFFSGKVTINKGDSSGYLIELLSSGRDLLISVSITGSSCPSNNETLDSNDITSILYTAPSFTFGSDTITSSNSIIIKGNKVDGGDPIPTEFGIAYSTQSDKNSTTTIKSSGSAANFDMEISNLDANTKYYIWLYAKQGDITVLSTDSAIITTANQLTGITGVLDILTASPMVGDNISFRVSDTDLNVNASTAETIIIPTRSDKGEMENVTLTETGANTGVFEGSISTVSGTSAGANNTGTFNAENNTVITATYDDTFDANGNNPSAVTRTVTMIELAPTFTWNDFLGDSIVLSINRTVDGSNNVLSETLYNSSNACYPNDFEIFFTNNTSSSYVNTDINYIDCSTSFVQFTQEWSLSGNTLTISDVGGSNPVDRTLEFTSATTFIMRTNGPGGNTIEWYYTVL